MATRRSRAMERRWVRTADTKAYYARRSPEASGQKRRYALVLRGTLPGGRSRARSSTRDVGKNRVPGVGREGGRNFFPAGWDGPWLAPRLQGLKIPGDGPTFREMLARDDFHCGVCGNEVSPNAKGCSGCGARRDGRRWFHDESRDGLSLPDEDFDYEAFLEQEFGTRPADAPKPWKRWFWAAVAVLTLLALLWMSVGGIFF